MLKATTILVDFACWSTVACVRNIACSESRWLRFFWFLIFLAMIVVFIYQLVMIILKYISYPSDVFTSIVFSSQPFPDVTFCSYNPFKLSVVEKNDTFKDMKRMLAEYEAAETGTSGTNEFGFQGLNRFERQDRANDLVVFLAAQLTEAQKAPALYKLDELVTECLFAGNTCDPSLIVAVPDPVYGRCFVFKGASQTITRSGLAHGLRLIVTANLADSLTFASDYLPTTSRVGIRMAVNEENSFVSLDNHGFNVGVGFQTSIAISKSRTELIKAPYGECITEMAPDTNHYSELPYNIDSCFLTCLQKKIVERCGCAHPFYRKADNETWCSTATHATCVASHRGDQLNATEPNVNEMDDCGCKSPCTESYFRSTLSVLTYPAFGYTVGVGTTEQNNNQKEEQEAAKTTTTSTTTTTTTTTTTEPPTTSPICLNDYTQNQIYKDVMATGKFTVSPTSRDPCTPVFECKGGRASQWWTCWPCVYSCPGNDKLPQAPYKTPNIGCNEFFNFAKLNTECENSDCYNARPQWNNWWKGTNPNDLECQSDKDKMLTIPNDGLIKNCSLLEAMYKESGAFTLDSAYSLPFNKPTVKILSSTSIWSSDWPCSYQCNCNNCGERYPTSGNMSAYIQRIRCLDFYVCFKIDTSGYTYRPIFTYWDNGASNVDCVAAKGPAGYTNDGIAAIGGARKKRSDPLIDDTLLTTTANLALTTPKPSIAIPGKGSCESWNSNFKSVDDCKAWYKSNGMIVNVFYESLEYQVLTENAAYSIPLAINDLGGQAGLWLGLSVVSVVECIGLFFLLLLFCITGKRLSVTPERERRPMPDMDDMPTPTRK